MDENEILQLIPHKKKGLLRIVFSRFGMAFLLLLLELMVIVAFFRWFGEYFKWLTVVQYVFAVGMVIYLFNCEMDATAKLTWMFLITLFPIPATILLWYTRTDLGHRMTMRRVNGLIGKSKGMLEQDPEVFADPEIEGSATDDLCRYLNRSGCFPLYKNTEAVYFPLGENTFEKMLEELQKAEEFIFMEFFIIDEGYMWGRILKILAEKAAQGVDVRVMYDGMCEAVLLPHDYPQRMKKLGIQCKPFEPLMPFMSTQYNYRDHRKILVIDGKTAFTGGINLADEYINRVEHYGHWKDTAVMLRGEAVRSFTLMFLQMWNIDEADDAWEPIAKGCKAERSDGYVIPYCDSPLDNDKVGENVYMDILNRAKTYVHIMTPYLILDNELENALKYAAMRGVDVRIILPGIPDKTYAYALAKTHYRELIHAGVKLYEYTPGFVHAKVFVSDDEKGVVGTINMDYRSLYHHFECAAYMYKTSCIADMEKDFQDTLAKCREVTPETIKKEKITYKVMGGVLKIMAPLM
ncbi:MAG: cardiolipin synthase [Eubacteriales bacterium]|nr:cardiolipin synthase [Eubacteriales bacterium]